MNDGEERLPSKAFSVGERVQLLRSSRGWSQATLAEKAGLSQATVANFERGRTTGGLAVTVAKLARTLNVNPEWLRTGKGDPSRLADSAADEQAVLTLFRQMSPQNRDKWLFAGRLLLSGQAPSDTA